MLIKVLDSTFRVQGLNNGFRFQVSGVRIQNFSADTCNLTPETNSALYH